MNVPLMSVEAWRRRRRSLFTWINNADRGASVVEDLENGDRVGMGDQGTLEESGAKTALDLLDLRPVTVTVPGQRIVRMVLTRLGVQDQTGGAKRLGKERDPALAAKDGRFIGSVNGRRGPQLGARVGTVHPLHRDRLIRPGW